MVLVAALMASGNRELHQRAIFNLAIGLATDYTYRRVATQAKGNGINLPCGS